MVWFASGITAIEVLLGGLSLGVLLLGGTGSHTSAVGGGGGVVDVNVDVGDSVAAGTGSHRRGFATTVLAALFSGNAGRGGTGCHCSSCAEAAVPVVVSNSRAASQLRVMQPLPRG
ncbi:hypothetical protein [Synechococcus sp. HK01-R]|uniref:hypothetical protein n=1 Tax=Synechococcus sp. HK01-R TaxID=2751171 RepID=UPI001626B686|nr:hypothetical protein [Synechococcus sp. HK01-R]QNG27859.1 hypothetical protein H0O21_04565 [Synechococcus sp. HK01-R]